MPAGSGSNSRAPLRDVKRCNKYGSFKKSKRGTQGAREVRFASPVDFVPPGQRARFPQRRRPPGQRLSPGRALSVAVIAVTGTVQAVGGAVTGAVTVVTRGRDPCAGCDRLRACRDRVAGRSLLSRRASGPGLHRSALAAPEPLAHEPAEVAIAPGGTSSHVRLSRPLLPRVPDFGPVAMHVVSVVLLRPVGPAMPAVTAVTRRARRDRCTPGASRALSGCPSVP